MSKVAMFQKACAAHQSKAVQWAHPLFKGSLDLGRIAHKNQNISVARTLVCGEATHGMPD